MAIRGNRNVTTETQIQDREQESIAVVDYEDPQRDGGPLRLTTQERVKKTRFERDEPKRRESLMNSKLKWKSVGQKCDNT